MAGRKILASKFLFAVFALLVSSTALAQGYGSSSPQEFQRRFSIGNRINGVIVTIAWPSDKKDIEKLGDIVTAEAERTYNLLNANNPQSEAYRINSSAGSTPVVVSWQTIDAIKKAKQVAQWTKGTFDIVTSNGNYNDIEIDDKTSTVKLKNGGMRISFDPIIDGFLADYIINMIYTANVHNAMVKVGNVFRGIGNGLHGPWKIQVQEDSAAYARHALNLTVSNTGIATVSATQFRYSPLVDFRSKKSINPRLKGATIVMNDAMSAQGIAYAVFVWGPQEGINFLNKFGRAKGLIVDSKGKFLRTAGM